MRGGRELADEGMAAAAPPDLSAQVEGTSAVARIEPDQVLVGRRLREGLRIGGQRLRRDRDRNDVGVLDGLGHLRRQQ